MSSICKQTNCEKRLNVRNYRKVTVMLSQCFRKTWDDRSPSDTQKKSHVIALLLLHTTISRQSPSTCYLLSVRKRIRPLSLLTHTCTFPTSTVCSNSLHIISCLPLATQKTSSFLSPPPIPLSKLTNLLPTDLPPFLTCSPFLRYHFNVIFVLVPDNSYNIFL